MTKWSQLTPMRRNLLLFAAGTLCLGLTSGIFETTYSNYVIQIFHFTPQDRANLEFPREFPGFMVAFLIGLLAMVPVARLSFLAAGCIGAGVFGLALFSPSTIPLVAWTLLWSIGSHLMMPVADTIGVALAREGAVGRRLGQLGSVSIVGVILGCLTVIGGMGLLKTGFTPVLLVGAVSATLGVVVFSRLRLPRTSVEAPRLVWKKEYRVFYWLNILFGARKQIFITFGPLVLIQVFKESAATISFLYLVSAVLGIGFRPTIGWLLDRVGERKVLVGEAMMLIVVCMGYAYGGSMWGKYVIYACYVLDLMLVYVGVARTTYLNKIIVNPADLTPTLSMGVTINHVVSMLIPALGGLAWAHSHDFSIVFLVAALIALINAITALLMRIPEKNVLSVNIGM